jgi:hypothetical protein
VLLRIPQGRLRSRKRGQLVSKAEGKGGKGHTDLVHIPIRLAHILALLPLHLHVDLWICLQPSREDDTRIVEEVENGGVAKVVRGVVRSGGANVGWSDEDIEIR